VKTYRVSLKVNGQPVELSGFPRDFLAGSLAGGATALRGVDEVDTLKLTLRFGKVKLEVNGAKIDLIQFPNLILANTLIGVLSSLNGIEGEVKSADVKIEAIKP
jgi:hypothetical protein